jgi:hypothetical protein
VALEKVASACHWNYRQTVAVAHPDTTLIPPRRQYSATNGKAEKGNRLRYPELASPGRTPATPRLSSQDEVSHPSLLEWIYCNRTATRLIRASSQWTK